MIKKRNKLITMKKENHYALIVTEHQLRLISECVEDCHRFLAGQFELQNITSRLDNYKELQQKLRELKPLITPDMPDPLSSYGWDGGDCPNDCQRSFIAETYAIYREILHFLATKNNLDNVYALPTLTCEEGGYLPTIKEI